MFLCLQVAHTHDAIMAYYYLDENQRVKVTEIFDVSNVQLEPAELQDAVPSNTVVNFEMGGLPIHVSRSYNNSESEDSVSRKSSNQEAENLASLRQELLQHGCYRCRSRQNSVSSRSSRSRAGSMKSSCSQPVSRTSSSSRLSGVDSSPHLITQSPLATVQRTKQGQTT